MATIDLTIERPIRLADVPKLPWLRGRCGRRLHIATVFRWCQRGLRGKQLEYVQQGGTRVTTEEALVRFFDSLTDVTPTAEPTKRQRCQSEHTEGELDRLLGGSSSSLSPANSSPLTTVSSPD
jgi:hypothetical protein